METRCCRRTSRVHQIRIPILGIYTHDIRRTTDPRLQAIRQCEPIAVYHVPESSADSICTEGPSRQYDTARSFSFWGRRFENAVRIFRVYDWVQCLLDHHGDAAVVVEYVHVLPFVRTPCSVSVYIVFVFLVWCVSSRRVCAWRRCVNIGSNVCTDDNYGRT